MHPAPPSTRPLAASALGAAVLFGHTEGFSWDEALMVLAPIAILAGILLYANHKVQGGFGSGGDKEAGDGPGAAAEPRPSEAATPPDAP